MDQVVTNRRGMFRIGVVLIAMSALVLAFALTGPLDPTMLWPVLALAVPVATGLGLLVGARFARGLAGLMLLAGAVILPLSLVRGLLGAPAPGELGWWLAVANAVATTALLVWLCVIGIQVVRGAPWRARVVTARLAGGALVAIAANHLWLAAQVGFGWHGSWAINVSALGTQLSGFPGWPLWHLAVLVAALALLAGRRHGLRAAATVLTVVLACLAPLALVAIALTDLHLLLLLLALAIPGFATALAWWLRQALADEGGEASAASADRGPT